MKHIVKLATGAVLLWGMAAAQMAPQIQEDYLEALHFRTMARMT